jgi:hypothetical protein
VGILFAVASVRAMVLAIRTPMGPPVDWVFGAVLLLFAASWMWHGEQLRRRLRQSERGHFE